MKIQKRTIFVLLAISGFLFIWFSDYVSHWTPLDQYAVEQKQGPHWKVQGDEQFEAQVQSRKILSGCYGFEGECKLKDIGIRLKLSFSGLKIKKPIYVLFDMMGGSRGWMLRDYYYGIRKLTITKSDGSKLNEFTQTIWNTGGYSDFSQILFIDPTNRELLVPSGSFGFTEFNLDGYAVQY